METFLSSLADILDVDAVQPTDVLEDFSEWDSLSILSIIAMADSTYQVNLNAAHVKNVATAGELFQLIQKKQGPK